jgi:hypothetical protein
MKYPKLVRNPHTSIRVVITSSEPNEFNELETLLDDTFLCNWQDSAKTRYTSEKAAPEVFGTAYIDGDILPDQPIINSGHVVIFGETHNIRKGTKARNLDGSVNYTKIEVI